MQGGRQRPLSVDVGVVVGGGDRRGRAGNGVFRGRKLVPRVGIGSEFSLCWGETAVGSWSAWAHKRLTREGVMCKSDINQRG
jgi:hypothetical protein